MARVRSDKVMLPGEPTPNEMRRAFWRGVAAGMIIVPCAGVLITLWWVC